MLCVLMSVSALILCGIGCAPWMIVETTCIQARTYSPKITEYILPHQVDICLYCVIAQAMATLVLSTVIFRFLFFVV